MRLSKRITQRLDAERVRRINEIYHNLENAAYDRQHEDISKFEESFWKDAARRYIPGDRPVVWLDYGAGTGFVPLAIGECLKAADTLISCDVSAEMLRVCAEKLSMASLPCECSLQKIEGATIPAERQSVDVLSVNSVLHHLFDLGSFAAECERVLKPAGLLIAAHEPNANTDLPLAGRLLRNLAGVAFRPKTILFRIAEWSAPAERLLRRITSRFSARYRRRNKMLADVACQIRQEGLLDFELRGTEIQQIVDFHSQQGFRRDALLGELFRRFDVLDFQTYGHLGFFPDRKSARAIDRYLKRRWPGAGREMCFVLRLAPRAAGK